MPITRVKRVYGVRLKAPRSPNGNPRRCWVVFDVEGERIDAIDEGFAGKAAFTGEHPGGVELMEVSVNYTQYQQALSHGPIVPREGS